MLFIGQLISLTDAIHKLLMLFIELWMLFIKLIIILIQQRMLLTDEMMYDAIYNIIEAT